MHLYDIKGPDPVLVSLPERVLVVVEDALSNDESSTDAEMAQYLLDIGLTDVLARHAVSYRDVYRLSLWIDCYTPIRSAVRVRCNRTTGEYEIT
ncbi:hypothetical protein [Lysobacter antibioticus]|uniref:hypothetical protein n=1 Tax=Lysobacter antibioticus TaxID=84531 RepID=UPI00071672B0|nr:hypothetical protein [Lysobacter antibioticus]